MSQELTVDGLVWGIFWGVIWSFLSTPFGWATLAIFILGCAANVLSTERK
ncbi:hypothetical protein Plim_2008 [Planctopirus limnophila DSM 3776]|uniref:Uncharacterized protein n=1 Tax=Planctopirus limnophila (strain ATCC 43296 / DSM 3776 / IFAM 1008 / Mu 290) TaxID=521674 RepID=D5SYQ5_PLAL2|nr:hypothetical protein Plim_2008 [Planctopirus limnophila DSM 3776]